MNNDVLYSYFESNLYCTVASVTPDGKPWASPLYFGFDENYCLYIRSVKDSQHMVNLRNNGLAFVTIYDSSQPIGRADGLYLECEAFELQVISEIADALAVMNERIQSKTSDPTKFLGKGSRRMMRLKPIKAWVNKAEVTSAGFVDYREEVQLP